MSGKVKVVVVPGQDLCADILSEKAKAKLESFADVVWNEDEKPLSAAALKGRLPGAWGCLTSWGAPTFDEDILSAADSLEIVGHAAGSVKKLCYPDVFDRGIKVVNAAATIADSVAEFTLTTMLTLLRRIEDHNQAVKGGGWPKALETHELHGATVGLVSASLVGRRVINLLKPFGCSIKIYDPYLPAARAAELGVELASLEEVMSCPIISLHAPVTEETMGLITADLIKLIPDGAVFCNNARAVVVDYDALLAELQTGRFVAALDVFPKEPPEADSPFRTLPNAILTPHIAGRTDESRRRLVGTIVNEFKRFLDGEPLQNEVDGAKMAILA